MHNPLKRHGFTATVSPFASLEWLASLRAYSRAPIGFVKPDKSPIARQNHDPRADTGRAYASHASAESAESPAGAMVQSAILASVPDARIGALAKRAIIRAGQRASESAAFALAHNVETMRDIAEACDMLANCDNFAALLAESRREDPILRAALRHDATRDDCCRLAEILTDRAAALDHTASESREILDTLAPALAAIRSTLASQDARAPRTLASIPEVNPDVAITRALASGDKATAMRIASATEAWQALVMLRQSRQALAKAGAMLASLRTRLGQPLRKPSLRAHWPTLGVAKVKPIGRIAVKGESLAFSWRIAIVVSRDIQRAARAYASAEALIASAEGQARQATLAYRDTLARTASLALDHYGAPKAIMALAYADRLGTTASAGESPATASLRRLRESRASEIALRARLAANVTSAEAISRHAIAHSRAAGASIGASSADPAKPLIGIRRIPDTLTRKRDGLPYRQG